MKNEYRIRVRLLFPAFLLAVVLSVLLSASIAFAGTVAISNTKCNLYTKGGRKTIQLSLTDNGQPVSAVWKSSNKKVAKVTDYGLVKAKKTGTARITATYMGVKYTCKIRVRKTSQNYRKCIKRYNTFLKQRYVTYKADGSHDQADNFCCVDLDKNGIPELLVNVVVPGGDRYHVLYRFTDGKMSKGQMLGICKDFSWCKSRMIVNYTRVESDQALSVYSKDNGVTLNSVAVGVYRYDGGQSFYQSSANGKKVFYKQMSALGFRNYVDHDLLNYKALKKLTLHVNTPSNRKKYLK